MVMRRTGLALPVVVAVLLLSAVLGAARPLAGGGWAIPGSSRGEPLPDGGISIIEAIRQLYLQQLGGPGASCQTNSPNNGCPP
ncbi:uncharacterized protein LOC133925842 [Phragmites australis]|uniref:uncharacterized protein LOC133925842 n=1 Tax=Phragmites australis TaxID=29695 RepID=UPI002D78BEE0|nr:uncharacterized protein LOC133925842 [Phragmites australis]